jgi:multimeric flavodoxin WrbA
LLYFIFISMICFEGMAEQLTAVFLLGTLKLSPEFSHTDALCEFLAGHLKEQNVTSEIIRLVDFNIKPGVETDMGGDDWPKILDKVLAADIVIFATPIWWGIQSSVIQRVIERMDALNDELLETGKSELANKVGGIVITGAEDGAEHIIGNLSNFMVWNGLTMPPACSLSWLGDASKDTKQSLIEKFGKQKSTTGMAKTMSRNLVFFSRLLKANPMPEESGAINQDIFPGTVGLRGDKT